jgi:UDP-N-acetylglucosamine 2-epimerase (non-hydrolysing)
MGYMGLPMACLIADAGYQVIGVDISERKITELSNGRLPLGEDEPGFKNLFQRVFSSGRLTFSNKPVPADIFVVAVPTDQREERIDLSCVTSAVSSLVPVLEDENLVIVESTIKPGTADTIVTEIVNQSGKRVHVAHCPERAVPGNTLWELINNDRIVGGVTITATRMARRFYSSFVKGRVLETCARTAECAKLMENTFRDVNIALANEFDQILAELGVPTAEAIALANCHPRVNILSPGPGVGGHCIPVDPYFLVEDCEAGDLVRRARKINHNRPKLLLDSLCERDLLGKRVVVAGVAYKPGVDDARESPAWDVVRILEDRGFEVRCSDPFVQSSWYRPLEALDQLEAWADTILIVTEHQEYKDFVSSKKLLLSEALAKQNLAQAQRQAA